MQNILNTGTYHIPCACFCVCFTILGENIVLLGHKLYAYTKL